MNDEWVLRDNQGDPVIDRVTASINEIRVLVEAADVRFPDDAPHYAVDLDDPDFRIEAGELDDDRRASLERVLELLLLVARARGRCAGCHLVRDVGPGGLCDTCNPEIEPGIACPRCGGPIKGFANRGDAPKIAPCGHASTPALFDHATTATDVEVRA